MRSTAGAWRPSPRGGHLPGAVSLPSAWLGVLGDDDLRDLLAVKGVTPDAALVLDGSRPGDVDALRARLAELGFDDARAYDEWARVGRRRPPAS